MALLTFIFTVNDTFFFRTYIFGLPSACSAVCVAMKQVNNLYRFLKFSKPLQNLYSLDLLSISYTETDLS